MGAPYHFVCIKKNVHAIVGEDSILPRGARNQSSTWVGEFIPAPDVFPFNQICKIHQVAGG